MTTLTLSRFAKAFTVATEKPAQAPAMPFSAVFDTSAKDVANVRQVQPLQANSGTIAATLNASNDLENDLVTKADLKARQDKLRAELEATDRELQELRDAERADVLKSTMDAMSEYGFTVDELLGRSPAARRSGKGVKRGPAAIKYADKASGSQWSGRGQKPGWIVAAIAGGKKLEDFAV